MLSGAVLDTSGLDELLPDWKTRGAPVETPVRDDRIYYLTERSQVRFPFTPRPLRNHGNYIISLNRFVRWLSEQAEAEGIDMFSGFAGTEVLYEGPRVVGVRTGDRGIDRHGERKGTFEPGVDIKARVTIFADGVRGNLTKTLIHKLRLEGPIPQTYAIGIKELWEIPPDRVPPGRVVHTMGYPLRNENGAGGGFIYALPEGRLAIGFVVGLDYRDPLFDPHMAFQRFKQHPLVSAMLSGGQMTRYGAKALPEGGWHAIPRCHVDGALVVGDAAGFMNSERLKGIHLAMKSGMCAADTAFDALRAGDVSASKLAAFQRLVNAGSLRRELYPVRNVHQAFGAGFFAGAACAQLVPLTGGWWPRALLSSEAGHERMARLARYYRTGRPDPDGTSNAVKVDRRVTFDKLTNVHYSGTRHDEDQRCICSWLTPTSAVPGAARSTATRVCVSVRPTSTRWSVTATGRAMVAACTSTRRTASTARPATSWIPIRSSIGCRPRAGADPNTKGCRMGSGSRARPLDLGVRRQASGVGPWTVVRQCTSVPTGFNASGCRLQGCG